jgi:hypothetical protein
MHGGGIGGPETVVSSYMEDVIASGCGVGEGSRVAQITGYGLDIEFWNGAGAGKRTHLYSTLVKEFRYMPAHETGGAGDEGGLHELFDHPT